MNAELGRVMLVDDEQIDQLMYRRILKRSGMAQEVIGFTYAEDAIAYLEDETTPSIDLILLDINMPRMNGFEFLEQMTARLTQACEASVVIMLTTSLNPRDKNRAASFEAVQGYVNKPLAMENLQFAAEILSKKRAGLAEAHQDCGTKSAPEQKFL